MGLCYKIGFFCTAGFQPAFSIYNNLQARCLRYKRCHEPFGSRLWQKSFNALRYMFMETAKNTFCESSGKSSDRISRLRHRYQTGPAYISIERAKFYTRSWEQTERDGTPLPVRVALAMQNVYENMTHYLDPDDRIAGYWTEFFLGVPIDIERGVFNSVFESEVNKVSMLKFRAGSIAKGLVYMVRKGALPEFIKNQKITKAAGAQPLNMDLKTMSERKINPYRIQRDDEYYLLNHLLPYWKGRSLVDVLEKETGRADLYSGDMYDFMLAVPGNTSRQVLMLSTCASIATYQAHVILDYEKILREGLVKMRADVAAKLDDPGLDPKQREFLESVKIAFDGVMIFARRLAERIERELTAVGNEARKAELSKMLDICRKVPFGPAETFREAIQSMWTVKTAVEVAHPVYLSCFGRIDQNLYPYYRKDIDRGNITREEARELLNELLLKIMSHNIRPESNILSNFYHRYLGSMPITLGGVSRDGEDASNELTYLFIEAAHQSKAITNVSVRISPKTPDELLLKIADALREGTSSFSLFGDDINIEAMMRRGFSLEDARDYAVMGCVETTCPGKTGAMSANALQLSRLLDITLRNGDSKILAGTIKGDGLRTGDPDTFRTFDDFIDALQKQAAYFIGKIVAGSDLRDKLFERIQPAPYLSAFVDGCIDNKKDLTAGGCRYELSGISFVNSIANMTDSLYVIKKLIFEDRKYSFRELLDAIDNNYVGYEKILSDIKKLEGKWGNGNPETDNLARDVMKRMFAETYKYRSYKGGPFVAYVISMITHTIDGRLSIASLDGRPAATPYAASCNPYNVDRSGVTATLRSVAALPFEDVMGCAVNVKFHPTGIGENPEARAKWVSLIKTYFQLGGSQIQPTVVSSEMLRDAQSRPEMHRDLIVKVGGYSTYFVDLGREIQEEIIGRTEHR